MTNSFDKTTWIITEGLIGTENQCQGVCEALGVTPEVKRISLSQPWKSLSPYIGFENDNSFSPQIEPPWPDLLITSGRKSIAAARYVRKQSKGLTKVVHIQDPRSPDTFYDLLCVPQHDPKRGQNIFVSEAAPNKITPLLLGKATKQFSNLAELPSPRIAVLIGGKSKAYNWSDHDVAIMASQLQTLSDQGYSLMITASRRTSDSHQDMLHDALKDKPNIIFWDGSGDNPYLAMLGLADFIIVTQDSVSMTSEAATTGKPVYIIPMQGGSKRLNKFHAYMLEKGKTRLFDGALEQYSYEPLDDAHRIATEIRKLF